ncbi:MAG: NTP transferase domain-containing protein [Bacteroidia bacterium]
MSADFYLLSVPVQCGKTTMLEAWAAGQEPGTVGGFLSPDRGCAQARTRVFYDVASGREYPFEWEREDQPDPEDCIPMGRFRFRKSSFDWAHAALLNAAKQAELSTVMVDEIGPLELRMNSGLQPVLSTFIQSMQGPEQAGRKVLLVVRDYLLAEFLRAFPGLNPRVNQGPWFPPRPDLRALVLSGGQSSRMGKDKAFIQYHEQPQYRYALDQMKRAEGLAQLDAGIRSFVISGRAEHIFDLESDEACWLDAEPFAGHGPISGLLTAHNREPSSAWLVMGVDYPQLQDLALQRLILAYRVSGRSVCFAPANPETKWPNRAGLEPLVALYAPADLAQLLVYFQGGGQSLKQFLLNADPLVLPFDERLGLVSFDSPPA